MKEIIIKGECGKIECRYHESKEAFAPVAMILHPHPLHGGNMNNKVVYHTFHTFVENKFSVLRFNFRGVNKSEGSFDNGEGEMADAAIAMDWLHENNPEASSFWVAGFSFGAWIAFHLLTRRPEISGFVAISPPANKYDFGFLSPCPAQGIIIQGTEDKIVPENDVYDLFEKVDRQRSSNVEYLSISGANHFFKDKIDELKNGISEYITPKISLKQSPRVSKKDRKRKESMSKDT